MDKKRNLLAILVSPVIGEIFFLIVFFINNKIASTNTKEMDGPMIADSFFYYLVPILFIGALIFQIIILEPIFRIIKTKIKLQKIQILKICIILIIGLSILFSSIFGTIQFGIKDYLIAFAIGLVIWTSYFVPNFIAYYLIYVKRIEMK